MGGRVEEAGMTGSVERRIGRLEALHRPLGCDQCRWWTPFVFAYRDKPQRPEVCACGRHVPIKHVTHFDLDYCRMFPEEAEGA